MQITLAVSSRCAYIGIVRMEGNEMTQYMIIFLNENGAEIDCHPDIFYSFYSAEIEAPRFIEASRRCGLLHDVHCYRIVKEDAEMEQKDHKQ